MVALARALACLAALLQSQLQPAAAAAEQQPPSGSAAGAAGGPLLRQEELERWVNATVEARVAALTKKLLKEHEERLEALEEASHEEKQQHEPAAAMDFSNIPHIKFRDPKFRQRMLKMREERRLSMDNMTMGAANAEAIAALQRSVDVTWILCASCICFLMQAGFALLEGGALRAKNVKNIMMKNMLDAIIAGWLFYFFGWGLAYGSADTADGWGDGEGNPILGTAWFFLNPGEEIDYVLFCFNYVFAATIATIVSGAVAERIQLKAYMVYCVFLVGFIYPLAAHWQWSADGWLNKFGTVDYAGGGAVHQLSGVAAWAACIALGPRKGKFDENGKPVDIPPHDYVMMTTGFFLLFFGFICFNAGSGVTVVGDMADHTARIAAITILGGCSGGVWALLFSYLRLRYAALEYVIGGTLAGMVSVCSCCGTVLVWHVFFFISPMGCASYFLTLWINDKLKIDDPLGASALHFSPGLVGLVAAGFFNYPDYVEAIYGCEYAYREGDSCEDFHGVFYGGTGKQLGIQVLAGLTWTVYGGIACALLFYGMKFARILRVPEEEEEEGLDKAHHGIHPGYEWMIRYSNEAQGASPSKGG